MIPNSFLAIFTLQSPARQEIGFKIFDPIEKMKEFFDLRHDVVLAILEILLFFGNKLLIKIREILERTSTKRGP